jgi:hypothetical protein
MMESINWRAASRATRLQAISPTLVQMPLKSGAPSGHSNSLGAIRAHLLPRTVERNRDRWSSDSNLVKIQPPAAIARS